MEEHSNNEVKSENSNSVELTPAQKAAIERNRQAALLRKQARLIPHPYAQIDINSVGKSIIKVQGTKFIDTGGGFLLEQKEGEPENEQIVLTAEPAPIIEADQPTCEDCQEKFEDSYLLQNFNQPVCDACRDDEEKHRLITKTDTKEMYLLKDCDLEKREPPLKFLMKKNPHNVRWGSMKLYLELQVQQRAIEVWGSEEQLEAERERREEERAKAKAKKYNKQMKALRMSVRSSLYDRTNKSTHQHDFGPETYNAQDDTYTHACTMCDYTETYEKM